MAKVSTLARVKAPWLCHPRGPHPQHREGDTEKNQQGHPKAKQHKITESYVLCFPAAMKGQREQADVGANPGMKKLTIMCISAAW